ncbi:MAG: phosphatidylserine decarboxylase [Acidobacteria bacterium]|nr:phosphatidylserine decarboxylase [Acidobacteriota bacterium]
MGIDRAGLPFIAAALLPAGALWAFGQPGAATLLAVAAGVFAFFFRDPDRTPPDGADVVVAPADGRVVHAGAAEPGVAPDGPWQQISIFLSPLDVHVNRMPVSGRIVDVRYRPGRFLPAYAPRAAEQNERSEIWIDHGGQRIVCRQVVGVLARRVVCRLAPGTRVALGQRFGVMKFGSRMDVFLPPSASVSAVTGDTVRGGETVVATLSAAPGEE